MSAAFAEAVSRARSGHSHRRVSGIVDIADPDSRSDQNRDFMGCVGIVLVDGQSARESVCSMLRKGEQVFEVRHG